MIRITQNFYQTKTKEAVHRWLSTLCLTAVLWLGSVGSSNVMAAPGDLATWALTTSGTNAKTAASIATGLNANSMGNGGGVTVGTPSSSYTLITTATAATTASDAITKGNYVTFDLTVSTGYKLDIATTDVLKVILGPRGSNGINAMVYYSIDAGAPVAFSSTVYTASGQSTPAAQTFAPSSAITVSAGQKITFYVLYYGVNLKLGISNFIPVGTVSAVAACPTYSLSNTAIATSPICAGTTATVKLTGPAANLPNGTYTVTYNLSEPNVANGKTATMTVSTVATVQTGTFTTGSDDLLNDGTTTITITQLVKGTCTSTISTNNTTTVTTNVLPTIIGTIPDSITGTGPATLKATSSAPGTISWFTSATGGSALTTGVTATSTTTSTFVTPSISETTTYYVQINDGTCTSSPRTPVIATVACTTYALSGTAIPTICTGATATVNLTGLAANLPIGTYTVTYNQSTPNAATGNTATMTVSTAGSGSFTTGTLATAGLTTITITQLLKGSCTNAISAGNTATVTTTALPTITGTNGSRIGTGQVNLTATSSPAGTISWYAAATGGSPLTGVTATTATTSAFTTPSISANTTYYVETTSGGCTSSPRTAVLASVTSAGAAEINVTGKGQNITDNDGSARPEDDTDFGATNIGVGVFRTYTIENTGGTVLNITGVAFDGEEEDMFTVTTQPSATVAPGGSTTFVVRFTGTTSGDHTTTVRIANTDSDEGTYDFQIKGRSGTPEINIKGDGDNIEDEDDEPKTGDHTDFTSTAVNGGTITRTFTIQNTTSSGRSILTIGAISIIGANAADFTVTALPGSTSLTGGGNTTFQVTFNPSASGLREATISIASNDSDENPYTFDIQGTGSEPEIDVLGNAKSIPSGGTNTPSTTDNTDFGYVNETGTTTTKTIIYTIKNTNTGTESLTIGGISFGGAHPGDFAVTAAPGSTTLAGGATTTFSVTFNPSTIGVKTATISIINNDSNESPYVFNIRGEGTLAPEINIQGGIVNNIVYDIADEAPTPSPTNYTDFGNHNTGTPTTHTYTIYNALGGGPLTLGAINLTGTGYTYTAPVDKTVVAGGSTTFTITFNPTVAGTTTGNFSMVTNDDNENPYNFALTGKGTDAPEIDIRGKTISIINGDSTPSLADDTYFGSVDFSSGTIVKTFSIHNTGTINLTVGTITKTGTNPGDFTVTTTPGASVTAGQSTNLVITFDPLVAGLSSAIFSIANGDADENPYVFQVTGNGSQQFTDSDFDNIKDNDDDDDDNDGILDIIEELNCTNANGIKANYAFLKETFGTGARGSMAGTNYCYEDGIAGASGTGCTAGYSLDDGEYTLAQRANISEWSDGTTNTKWYQGGDHTGDTGGRMALFNAKSTPGVFYTATVVGTLPGIPLTYSFWALNLDRADDPDVINETRQAPNITVEFRDMNDGFLKSIETNDIPASAITTSTTDWHQYTASLSLPENTFKVIFINNNTNSGGGNDLAIDDITITQSLCDYDNDDVADLFDLDADNDGIPDVVEAGLASLSNNTGKIDVTWKDTNKNGVHDDAEGIAVQLTLNSDSDTLPDYLDLDSDNDTVFDIDESGAGNTTAAVPLGYNNGDGDINGDGMGDGGEIKEKFRAKDTDGTGIMQMIGDGILDIFDYSPNTQYGNLNQAYPIDSDNDGKPDYIDPYNDTTGIYDIENNQKIYNYKTLVPDGNGALTIIVDADKDGIMDSFDTKTAVKGSPRDLYSNKLLLDFDGRNDYAKSTQILSGLANATLMAWISLNPAFATEGVVVGQDNFHIRITAARTLEAVVNGITATYGTALNVSQWYHITATYDNTNLRLYLNGKLMVTEAVAGPISADTSTLTIGRDPNSILPAGTKYFKGKIDEVRVFNIALTDIQVQRTVYQEIDPLSPKLKGTIANKEIAQDLYSSPTGTLTFGNLLRYYRMDTYKDDIIDDLSTPGTDVLTGAKIYNHKNIYLQQAPMPFVTKDDGDLATAVDDTDRDIEGSDINTYNTIINVKHDNTITATRTDLGLVVDTGAKLTVNGDSGLTNTWWLSLNGTIDLEGKSQLVQNSTSDLDVASAGSLHRDQQGQSNLHNYNYWSSPVSTPNTNSNNNGYTVKDVMWDGTTSTPKQITSWTDNYDANPATTPITLSRYWLYKFEDKGDAYANWEQFLETFTLKAGQGYTMKGSGTGTLTQNYTFVGKPNNGLINTNIVNPGNLLLVGNPYPSAIDGYQFIADNATTVSDQTVTDGTLYFWYHAPNNDTHILANYLGSYGVLNAAGGVSPILPTLISGVGSAYKTPSRFIPVGQGFFVYGKAVNGPVLFNNGQRAFVREDDMDASATPKPLSNTLFKTKASTKTAKLANNNNVVTAEPYKKIRLGYNTANGYHRQVLLAFMDEKATSGIDYGYDGEIMDDFPNDMSLLKDETQLVIEGEGYFDENISYPIGVKSDIDGKVSFIIDDKENFDPEQPIYIHDNLTDTYHDIREGKLEIDLPSTSSTSLNDRFSLRFKDKTLGVNENDIANENAIVISHTQKGNILEINNQLKDTTIEKVTLFNMLGQSLVTWKTENPTEQNIQIPLKNVSSGVYITKIKTSKGDVSKKIIIK